MPEEQKEPAKQPTKKIKLNCAKCGKNLKQEEALIHKNLDGKQEIICHDCFKEATGVDYKTFLYRREAAKQTLFATLFCIAATIYAFVEEGWEYGVAGIFITILIFLFSAKVK